MFKNNRNIFDRWSSTFILCSAGSFRTRVEHLQDTFGPLEHDNAGLVHKRLGRPPLSFQRGDALLQRLNIPQQGAPRTRLARRGRLLTDARAFGRRVQWCAVSFCGWGTVKHLVRLMGGPFMVHAALFMFFTSSEIYFNIHHTVLYHRPHAVPFVIRRSLSIVSTSSNMRFIYRFNRASRSPVGHL